MSDRLFDLEPVIACQVSARQLTERRRAIARIQNMHARHGHGPDGVTCGDCVHLVRRRGGTRSYLKCERYGITRSDASDWRKRWPACGAVKSELQAALEREAGRPTSAPATTESPGPQEAGRMGK